MIPNQPVNNNAINYTPMNLSQDSLYKQLFQQTFNFMQGKTNLVNINVNNMKNILSLINLPVVLPFHTKHPLINCKTPGREKPGALWRCNNCKVSYSYNVPSFYCTNCDFDLCQTCFLGLYTYQIVIYNYAMGMIQEDQNTNPNYFYPSIHNHPLMLIEREASYYTSDFKCNSCFKEIQKNEQFHFCSLCNYCLCTLCFNTKKNLETNPICDNPEYITANQMDPFP